LLQQFLFDIFNLEIIIFLCAYISVHAEKAKKKFKTISHLSRSRSGGEKEKTAVRAERINGSCHMACVYTTSSENENERER
jgi:hypothetical protein